MSEESTNEIILKVNKSKGKHMTFHDDDWGTAEKPPFLMIL